MTLAHFFHQKFIFYELHWNFLLMYSGENLPLKQNAGDMCLSLNTQSWSQSLFIPCCPSPAPIIYIKLAFICHTWVNHCGSQFVANHCDRAIRSSHFSFADPLKPSLPTLDVAKVEIIHKPI